MSSTRKELHHFLASRGQSPEQIATTEQDLVTMVNIGICASWEMAARRLMNVLVLSDDSATDLGAVHVSAQFTAAMQELVDDAGHASRHIGDASKRTTQIDMEHMKSGIQQLADDNTVWCSYCEQEKPRADCTELDDGTYICGEC